MVATITDAQSNTTTFTYDGRGNRLTSTDALSQHHQLHLRRDEPFDRDHCAGQLYHAICLRLPRPAHFVTDANGKATAYGYDDADRLTSVTDAASNVTV